MAFTWEGVDMAYAVIWITYLAASLLLIATVAALGARSARIKRAMFWPILAAVILFFWDAALTFMAGLLWSDDFSIRPTWLFPYSLSLTICFVIGAYLIIRRGLKKDGEEIAANRWPRAKLAGALGITFCLFLGSFHVVDLNMRIHQTKNQARVMAEAVRMWPARLPDEMNSALIYDKAAKVFLNDSIFSGYGGKHVKQPPKWLGQSTKADFDPSAPEVAIFLKENQETIDLLHQAAAIPGYYQEIDLNMLFSSPIPSFLNFRFFAQLLNTSARLKAQQGDFEGALDDLSVIKKMSLHLAHTPTLINQMVAKSMEDFRADCLEYILTHVENMPDNLIPKPINPPGKWNPFYSEALRFDNLAPRQYLSLLDQEVSGPNLAVEEFGVFGSWGLSAWRVFALPSEFDSMDKALEALNTASAKPYPQAAKELLVFEETFQKEPQGLFVRMFIMYGPITYRFRIAEADALQVLMQAALAATAFKSDRGEYPAALDELVPEYMAKIPKDPFNGKPVQLKVLDGGLDLSCVGDELDAVHKKDQGPIHFYLGAEAYEKYRVEPAREKREKEKKRRKKKRK